MDYSRAEHVYTRNKTLDDLRALVISEIGRNDKIMRDITTPIPSLGYLVAQRNAFEKVLELIAGLRRSEAMEQ